MSITPERLAVIRALGEDEFRDVLVMDDAVEDLLSEVDDLRGTVSMLGLILLSARNEISAVSLPDLATLSNAVAGVERIVRGWQA